MMQPENDMDELFQRAGTDYPLKSPEGDWNAIAMRLQQVPVSPAVEKPKNKKVFLVVSILITAMLVGLLTQLTIVNRNNRSLLGLSVTYENKPVKEGNPGSKPMPGVNKLMLDNPQASTIAGTRKIISAGKMFPNTDAHDGIEESIVEFSRNNRESVYDINPAAAIIPKPVLSKASPAIPEYQLRNLVPKLQKRSGIYAGIAAGPQFSEVKRQGIRKVCIEPGIITGYRFSRSISIETGLFFSHKTYYSDGKYFQMKTGDPGMPSGMEVLSLEGSSRVLEVPLKLKYDFSQKSKSNLFSSVGVSSYIMTKEKNNYHAMMNGAPQQMTGNYKNTNRYVAAAVNLSAGYEYKPGYKKTIRIEPYIQIPIRGMGVGSIPITSAGVHIGVIWNNK